MPLTAVLHPSPPPPAPAPRGPLARRRRRLVRRWLSAGLVAAAGAVTVSALAPASPATAAVLVAVTDLPAGAVVTAADIEEVAWPAGLTPGGLLSREEATGAVLVSALRRGEALTDTRTTGAGLLTGQPPGTLGATVDVGDPAALRGLAPGVHVDVLARTEDPVTGLATGAERVASDVVVLAVPSTTTESGFLGTGPAASATSVLVAVDPTTAADLTAAAGRTVVALRAP
ncbi:MAG: SAF domain-containing protein [Janthinobacterium lividum]